MQKMKLLFTTASDPDASKPDRTTYPLSLNIYFEREDVKNGEIGSVMGTSYKTLEDWITAVEQALLCFGINDFECKLPEEKEPTKDRVNIIFYFKSAKELLTTYAVTGIAPIAQPQTLSIKSPDPHHSLRREENIRRFANHYELPITILREDGLRFDILTTNIMDHLKIQEMLEKGSFDKGPLLTNARTQSIAAINSTRYNKDWHFS